MVFGSLYRDDVLIKPSRVVSILAAACMLQLVSMKDKPSQAVNAVLLCIRLTVGSYPQDGLIQQCGETMKENISTKTACGYYACASIYGLDSVMKKCD